MVVPAPFALTTVGAGKYAAGMCIRRLQASVALAGTLAATAWSSFRPDDHHA
jgi:hypothetical protein